MTAVELYNELDGQIVSRGKLMAIYALAMEQGQVFIQKKIQSVLDQYDDESFQINITRTAIDQVPEESLPGLEFAYPDDEFEGLEKAVSPDEIYQYITNLMINTIQEVGEMPWQKQWDRTSIYNGYQAMNWETKKGYRGINYFLLNFKVKIIDGKPTLVPATFKNPYFMTFKQIEKHGGQLKKGSTGKRVVYFTRLYHYQEKQPDGTVLGFGSYNQKKFRDWIEKNKNKLKILQRKGWSVERLAESYIPILKYYNVFHADDITGIDWGDLPKNENVEKTEKERIEIAEKIISLYPNPPEVFFKGDQPAYYPKLDQILMTPIDAFKSKESFYSTFFHELIHSTGHSKRLNRGNDTRIRDNSPEDKKAYAFEELVAEMGAVFLCAESGILFSTKDNSAKYLKGWNKALVKHMEDDNRFFFRAASRSQAAADHILVRDKDGIPAYQHELLKEVKKKESSGRKQQKTKKKVSKAEIKPDPKPTRRKNTNELLEEQRKIKLQAKTKAEFEKALKKMGFEIISYKSDQKGPRKWKRNYKLNFKDIAGVELEMDARPEGKEVQGDFVWKAIGIEADVYFIDYNNLQEFYEDILTEFQEVFGKMSIAEAEKIKKEYGKTLFRTKEPKTQLGLFGSDGRIRISTEEFKKMKVGELRKFTMTYYNSHLKGRKTEIKDAVKEVSFYGKSARKIMQPMYKEKAAVIEHLEELIKMSSYNNWGDRKKTDSPDTLGYLNFKSKLTIDGKKRHIRISIAVDRNRKSKFKSYEVGTKNKSDVSSRAAVANPSDGENTPLKDKNRKNNSSRQKKNNGGSPSGLKAPATALQPQIMDPAPPAPQPAPKGPAMSLAESLSRPQNHEIFHVPGDIGRFLGKVEKKPVHSVVTTLDAEQGAGKTRFLFQVMDQLASTGLNCLFISLEEHPQSKLFLDKVRQYIKPQNLNNISVIGEVESWNQVKDSIDDADIIFIDSFQKLPPNLELDEDIRKAFNGKWFFVIYQQTGTKTMRGGSKAAFDGDIILKVHKDPEDYRNNYVYANKNRYNDTPDLKLNIFNGRIMGEKEPDSVGSSTSGKLVATLTI